VLRVELSQKLDPTLNTNPTNIFTQSNQNPTLIRINHISMVFGDPKFGALPLC